jgi:hypothetical protein
VVIRFQDVPLDAIPDPLHTPYKVCVRRRWRTIEREAEYYPVPLRSRLPRIRVPPRRTDRDASLDLQALLDSAYVGGRYDRTRYDRPPAPPLSDEDMAWAMERIGQWNGQPG